MRFASDTSRCQGIRLGWKAGILFASLFLPLLGGGCDRPSGTGARAAASLLLADNLTTDDWNGTVEIALQVITRSTQFHNRWQINQPIKEDHLNVYVLRPGVERIAPSLPDELQRVLHTCAYIGPPNVIVCDGEFLSRFLPDHGIRPPEGWDRNAQEAWTRERQRALTTWILGHEAGHILADHQPAHFSPGAVEKEVSASTVGHQQEFEADRLAVQQIRRENERLLALTQLVVDLINADIRRRARGPLPFGVGLIYDYRSETALEYARRGTHPEYVVRGVRMLQLAPVDEGLRYIVNDLARRMHETGAPPHSR